MEMKLQFPADAPTVLEEITFTPHTGITIDFESGSIRFPGDTVIAFTLHTPDGDFTYTIDNKAKTLTTESDTPFLA